VLGQGRSARLLELRPALISFDSLVETMVPFYAMSADDARMLEGSGGGAAVSGGWGPAASAVRVSQRLDACKRLGTLLEQLVTPLIEGSPAAPVPEAQRLLAAVQLLAAATSRAAPPAVGRKGEIAAPQASAGTEPYSERCESFWLFGADALDVLPPGAFPPSAIDTDTGTAVRPVSWPLWRSIDRVLREELPAQQLRGPLVASTCTTEIVVSSHVTWVLSHQWDGVTATHGDVPGELGQASTAHGLDSCDGEPLRAIMWLHGSRVASGSPAGAHTLG